MARQRTVRIKKAPAAPKKEAEEMLRVEAAAKQLDVTPTTVRRWLAAGKLAGSRPGGTKAGWRIPASEIERVLAPTRREPAEGGASDPGGAKGAV